MQPPNSRHQLLIVITAPVVLPLGQLAHILNYDRWHAGALVVHFLGSYAYRFQLPGMMGRCS